VVRDGELNEEKTERTLVAILQKVGKKGKEILAPVVTEKETPERKRAGNDSEDQRRGGRRPSRKTSGETEAGTEEHVDDAEGQGRRGILHRPDEALGRRFSSTERNTGRKTPIVPTNPIKLSPGSTRSPSFFPPVKAITSTSRSRRGSRPS